MSRIFTLLSCLFISLTMSACSGVTVRKATAEADKDPTFSYDGKYKMTVKHPGGRQELTGQWFVTCGSRDFWRTVTVKNSTVSLVWNEGKTISGFVGPDGSFRISRPSDNKVNVLGGVASNDDITIVVQGVLDKEVLKGTLVYAQAAHVGRGCTYPVTYTARNAG